MRTLIPGVLVQVCSKCTGPRKTHLTVFVGAFVRATFLRRHDHWSGARSGRARRQRYGIGGKVDVHITFALYFVGTGPGRDAF